jgi:Flp pilus assembly pilin Flp
VRELSRRLWSDDSGQGLVEYVLIIALVAFGLLLVIIVFRNAIGRVFGIVSDTLSAFDLSCGQKGKSHNCF